jgi:AraC-like DNA-binding protein
VDGDARAARVATAALRSLARVRIERRLHDAAFGPAELGAELNVSRSKLYRAFDDGDGPAAAIRDARLDRAWQRLSSPENDGVPIKAIPHACGFTDAPTFSRAFRHRFGQSARDVRALRAPPP